MTTRTRVQRCSGHVVRRAVVVLAGGVALLGAATLAASVPALSQGFRWPWEEGPPRPREPLKPVPAPIPAQPPPPPAAASPTQAPQGGQWMTRSPICVQLEQRLAQENQRGASVRDQLPRLETEIRQLERTYHQGESQLERADCYEYFLFSKSLRNSKQCRDLSQQVEGARRRLGELEAQRQQIIASGGRSFSDDIVRELARNNCGGQYQQEASRGSGGGGGSIWQDSEGGGLFGGGSGGFGASQYNTYRTVCVRLCDGYYFPVSFATLPQRFQQDADACASKCAAPVELYYHPNPGGAIEQAVAAKSQEPYTKLKTAFRYRKEYVQGCSCKETEYVPPAGEPPANQSRPVPERRADRPLPAPDATTR